MGNLKSLVKITMKKKSKKLIKKWQKRLFLQDWEIQILHAEPHELYQNSRLAEVEYSTAAKEATIRICHPNPTVSETINQDVEFSIVHELLHLHFVAAQKFIEPDTAEHVMHEIAINQVSKALVNLRRTAKRKKR